MAKQKRYFYECVMTCDLPFMGPDQRRERWKQNGRIQEQPQKVLHVLRVHPSPGFTARGDRRPADYIVTDRPIGRSYTEEVVKNVSRSLHDGTDAKQALKRGARPKVSKIKFKLLDPEDVTDYVRMNAFDFEDRWGPALFDDGDKDVVLPKEAAAFASAPPIQG